MVSGNRIKEVRMKRGMTQTELGALINVSKVAVCGYEKGTRTPRLSKLRELSDKLNVSVSYLMGNDKDIIMENSDYAKISLSNEEINIIKEIRKHPKLKNELESNPKRTVEMIAKLIRFEK